MKRYHEYKASGVEWIREIPRDWEIMRCAHLFEVKHIKNTSGEINLSVYRDYGVIKRDSRDDNYNRVSEDTSNYKLVEPGDFVFNKMKCWQGSLGISEYRGIVSPAYAVCKPKRPFHGKYFHYLLRSWTYIQEFNRLSYGVRIGQWELRFEDFKDIVVPYPSKREQIQIAAFLDCKIEQIDELIRIKERRIELLHEQRTALINQAVTKGLDPNVEMKPSGEEWIGEIPKHWKIRKNKYIFDEKNDRSVAGNEELLTVSHITGVSPRIEKNVNMFLAETLAGYKHCSVGNLVINTMWAWMGALGISEFDGIVSPSYNVYGLKNDEYLPKYYDYLYRTPNHVREIIRWSKGIWHSRWRLYPDAFFSMSAIVPPFREQVQIVHFLNHKSQQIDELISAEQRKIELLKEYRQSLISEAVTGKIDVRNEV